jgi:hypothetical protein
MTGRGRAVNLKFNFSKSCDHKKSFFIETFYCKLSRVKSQKSADEGSDRVFGKHKSPVNGLQKFVQKNMQKNRAKML